MKMRTLLLVTISVVWTLTSATAAPKPLRIGEGVELVSASRIEQIQGDQGTELHVKSAKKTGGMLYIHAKITEESYKNGACPKAMFSFEYLDEGDHELRLVIDSSDPLYDHPKSAGAWKGVGGATLQNSGKWIKTEIPVYDALFNNRMNGSDFRLELKGSKHFGVRNLQITPLERGRHDMSGAPVVKGKPNILMIIVDDLNDYNGAYGDPNAKTPNIDKFVQKGVRFAKAYCQYPVCGPSRASFMSGLYPETIGVTNNEMHAREKSPDAPTMLQFFKENGYWTASAGKIFHSHTNFLEGGISTHQADWFHDSEDFYLTKKFQPEFEAKIGPVKDNQKAWKKYHKDNYVSPQRAVQALATGPEVKDEMHLDGKVRTRICEHLTKKPFGDRPFFIACGFTRPHVPHFAPKRFFDMYNPAKLKFADVPVEDWKNKPSVAKHGKYKSYGAKMGKNNRELRAMWLQSYLACISFVDEQIGKVLTALKNSGREDNTIVIFLTDHGYHMGEHFMYGKFTLFEESTRVPLVFKVPGVTKPGTTAAMTELVDIFPTLAELCGFTPPANLDGRSVVPVLKNPKTTVKDSAYTVMTRSRKGKPFLGKALHYDNWRYTDWGTPEDAELYDLSKDPDEYHNLAKNPEYDKLIKDLQTKMTNKLK